MDQIVAVIGTLTLRGYKITELNGRIT